MALLVDRVVDFFGIVDAARGVVGKDRLHPLGHSRIHPRAFFGDTSINL